MSDKIQKIAELHKKTLKNVLGVWDLFAIGYADVGSSIYYALGITALYAMGATPVSMAVAGLVFIFTSLTYAEMSAAFRDAGGSATFSRHAFNDLISFIAGWGLLLDYIVTIAISSFAIPPYIRYLFETLDVHWGLGDKFHLLLSVIFIVILFILNFIGIKHSTRVSKILTFFTLGTQLIIIGIALASIHDLSQTFSNMKIGTSSLSWSDFLRGTAMAMVAYTGIESIAQLGAETKNPTVNIPRAIKRTCITLILFYLTISIVALNLITPHELSTTYLNDPVAGIVSKLRFGSEFLKPWIGLLAACILFVAANAGLIGASRLSYKLGEFYQLPRVFFKTHSRFRTPYISLAIFAILATSLILASRGRLSFLADLYNFGAMIAFFSAHLSLIILRIKRPDLPRPFKVPLNIRIKGAEIPITAILGCLATFSIWVLVVITKQEGRILGFGWLAVGVLCYFIYRKRKNISAWSKVQIEKVDIPDYKTFNIQKILVATRGGSFTDSVQIACQLAKCYKAELIAMNVIEVPYALPIDAPLPRRTGASSAALKRAEAIAREYNIEVNLQQVRSRSTEEGILKVIIDEECDLLVIGATHQTEGKEILGPLPDKLLRAAPCKVWICRSSANTSTKA